MYNRLMKGRIFRSRLGGWVAALVAAGVLVPATDAVALWDDRLELFVAETVTRDDNIFRLTSGVDPTTALGSSSKGDTYHTTSFGFNLDVPVDRQRILGGVTWNDNRYHQFTVLDLTARNARAAWAWQVGNDLGGQLGYTETFALASLANREGGVQSSTPNPLKTQQALFNAAYRLTPRWRLRGEVSNLKQSNEISQFQPNDISIDGGELTVSYVTPANDQIGVSVRAEEASYPTPQPDPSAPGSFIDNAYRQESVAVVAEWTPTGRSRVSVRAGRVSRSYQQSPQRDFEGATYRAAYDWRTTARLTLTAAAYREISGTEETNIGFVLATGVALRPAFRLTEKIQLSGGLDYSDRDFLANPALQPLGGVQRTDRVRTVAVTAFYRPIRTVTLEMGLRRESRSSSVPFGAYELNVIGAGARWAF